MSYSIDLRHKVIEYVKAGHSQLEAAGVFKINRTTIYRWQQQEDLAPSPAKTRQRKLVKAELILLVKDQNDARLIDYAEQLGVSPVAVWKAFKRWGITKKNDPISGKVVYEKV